MGPTQRTAKVPGVPVGSRKRDPAGGVVKLSGWPQAEESGRSARGRSRWSSFQMGQLQAFTERPMGSKLNVVETEQNSRNKTDQEKSPVVGYP